MLWSPSVGINKELRLFGKISPHTGRVQFYVPVVRRWVYMVSTTTMSRHKILGRCIGDPLYFPMHLPDMSCFIRKIFAIKSRSRRKTKQCKSFWPPIFTQGWPRLFYTADCFSAIYYPPFWQSLVEFCRPIPPCAKPDNEVKCRIYAGWIKWQSNFKPFVDQSPWHFETT